MAPQTTLLDSALGSKLLLLKPNGPRNTNVTTTADSSEILYSVYLNNALGETEILKVEVGGRKNTLALVRLKEDGEGKIAFKNQKAIKLRDWLRPLGPKTL